jgi:hypothetical protein
VPQSALPERPGWYPDPYDASKKRWFDGSRWTMHAVPMWETDPDRVVQQNWVADPPETLRHEEWEDQFPSWDSVITRTSEPRYDRPRGYWVGAEETRRYGTAQPLQTSYRALLIGIGILVTIAEIVGGIIILALLAASHPDDRVAAVIGMVALIGVTVRTMVKGIQAQPRTRRIGEGFPGLQPDPGKRRHRGRTLL